MKIFLFLFFLNIPSYAEKTFSVAIKGEDDSLEDLKKSADLKMISSIKYCRGTYILSPITQWKCSSTECKRTYGCKLIHKGYSRATEIPKLKAQIKNNNIAGTIEMPEVKFLALDRPKPIVKKINFKIRVKKEVPVPKTDKFEEEALALLNQEDFTGARTLPEKISKMDRDITYEELVEPPTRSSPFEKKEADWKLVRTTSREGGMKRYELEKNLDKEGRFKKKLKGFALALGMLNVSGIDTNISSFYLGWVPRLELAPSWAIRGELGLQYFAQQFYAQNELIYVNNFMLSPYALYLNFYGEFYFLEAGGGFQWWYDQESELNPMLAAGLGYRFPDTFFALDRISLNYDLVTTLDDNLSEIKLSLTFIF